MKLYKTYNMKNIIKFILFIITLLILLILSKQNFESVKDSVIIFITSVLPSLFPFIFFTEVILHTNIIDILSRIFGNIISKVFKVNKNSTSAIIIGFLCGFPMGSKTVSTLYMQNKISRRDAKVLLSFVNNCNPAFILSTVGIAVFYNMQIGIILLISHIFSSILIGVIYSRIYHNDIIHEKTNFLNTFNEKTNKRLKNLSTFEIIKMSILSAFKTLANILGFIIIFNLLFNIIFTISSKANIDSNVLKFISSIFEVTKGAHNINNMSINLNSRIILTSFALGFSGLCIICQVYSTVCESKFKLKDIFIPKVFHGIISCFITYILLRFITISDVTTVSVFSNIEESQVTDSYFSNMKFYYLISTLLIILSLLIYRIILYINKKRKKNKSSLLK